ncbi:U2_small nuclear ribonucleoprotein A' [Hexamita inflata]|uniref:Putative n=1 Tax=Hexamita inflata TaxID=28002 RepID=A0AA86Q0U9_9EUKA|nr:U2 small nuclear ribonucleoprotein A' [Hexamita inflata]
MKTQSLSQVIQNQPNLYQNGQLRVIDKRITEIDEVPRRCIQATVIFISNNSLRDISGLIQFQCLQTLSLAHNQINSLQQIENLTLLPSMRTLRLDGNPVFYFPTYRQFTIQTLNFLTSLDGMQIQPKEKQHSKHVFDLERTRFMQLIDEEERIRKYSTINGMKNIVRSRVLEYESFSPSQAVYEKIQRKRLILPKQTRWEEIYDSVSSENQRIMSHLMSGVDYELNNSDFEVASQRFVDQFQQNCNQIINGQNEQNQFLNAQNWAENVDEEEEIQNSLVKTERKMRKRTAEDFLSNDIEIIDINKGIQENRKIEEKEKKEKEESIIAQQAIKYKKQMQETENENKNLNKELNNLQSNIQQQNILYQQEINKLHETLKQKEMQQTVIKTDLEKQTQQNQQFQNLLNQLKNEQQQVQEAKQKQLEIIEMNQKQLQQIQNENMTMQKDIEKLTYIGKKYTTEKKFAKFVDKWRLQQGFLLFKENIQADIILNQRYEELTTKNLRQLKTRTFIHWNQQAKLNGLLSHWNTDKQFQLQKYYFNFMKQLIDKRGYRPEQTREKDNTKATQYYQSRLLRKTLRNMKTTGRKIIQLTKYEQSYYKKQYVGAAVKKILLVWFTKSKQLQTSYKQLTFKVNKNIQKSYFTELNYNCLQVMTDNKQKAVDFYKVLLQKRQLSFIQLWNVEYNKRLSLENKFNNFQMHKQIKVFKILQQVLKKRQQLDQMNELLVIQGQFKLEQQFSNPNKIISTIFKRWNKLSTIDKSYNAKLVSKIFYKLIIAYKGKLIYNLNDDIAAAMADTNNAVVIKQNNVSLYKENETLKTRQEIIKTEIMDITNQNALDKELIHKLRSELIKQVKVTKQSVSDQEKLRDECNVYKQQLLEHAQQQTQIDQSDLVSYLRSESSEQQRLLLKQQDEIEQLKKQIMSQKQSDADINSIHQDLINQNAHFEAENKQLKQLLDKFQLENSQLSENLLNIHSDFTCYKQNNGSQLSTALNELTVLKNTQVQTERVLKEQLQKITFLEDQAVLKDQKIEIFKNALRNKQSEGDSPINNIQNNKINNQMGENKRLKTEEKGEENIDEKIKQIQEKLRAALM